MVNHWRVRSKSIEKKVGEFKVESYIDFRLRVRSINEIKGFSNGEAVFRVFDQNHFNSVLVELTFIAIIL